MRELLKDIDVVKVSPALLMRKFKLTHEMALQICEFIGMHPIESLFIDVLEEHAVHDLKVVVYGRHVKAISEELDYYLATYNAHCGWIDAYTHELLFVLKWMKLPIEEI